MISSCNIEERDDLPDGVPLLCFSEPQPDGSLSFTWLIRRGLPRDLRAHVIDVITDVLERGGRTLPRAAWPIAS